MRFIILLLTLFLSAQTGAFEKEDILRDASQEQMAKQTFNELRCIVCTSQSLAESDAPLARDIRKLVRKKIKEGNNQKEVLDYLVSRYGDEVLLKPPVKKQTYALWLLPVLLPLLGFFAVFFYTRRK